MKRNSINLVKSNRYVIVWLSEITEMSNTSYWKYLEKDAIRISTGIFVAAATAVLLLFFFLRKRANFGFLVFS